MAKYVLQYWSLVDEAANLKTDVNLSGERPHALVRIA